MDDDEEATVRTLTLYRTIVADLVQQFRGRIVDSPGDNILAEFPSVVDSVNCTVEIQRELAGRNAELTDNRKMRFRIGVNLGDVIEEDGRIYGDGVNIAARVESLCDAGDICLSGRAYDQVENKLELEYEDLGEHQVKNIARPIRVFRVLYSPEAASNRVVNTRETLEPASVEKMAFPLPEKPSIAVLPFDNMSGDPEQEYLADGISENIISALSYIPEMFVIARNSSFTYKGIPVKVQQVSEELGVRYVLEGSVMKSGNKVRITAQLIDAITGGHMWSERYDRDLKDVFSLLDDITQAVIVALQVTLTSGQQASITFGSTRNFEAWGYAVKGMSNFFKFGKEDMVRSRELFEKALQIDPKYSAAVTMLAWTHKIDASFGYTDSKENSIKLSTELAKKSIAMNDKNPILHSLFSLLFLIQGDHEKAVQEGEKAIALGPNFAEAILLFGEVLIYSGNFEEAVKMCEMAMRLHPYVALAERLIDLGRKAGFTMGVVWGHTGSALVKIKLGRLSAAKQDAVEILEIWPWFNLDYMRSIYFYKDTAHLEQWIEGLRMAGIPEHPPSH
jgi:adenylate cyclase